MVLMVAVVMLVAVAVPAMAQDDKAAKKAARQAERAAKRRRIQRRLRKRRQQQVMRPERHCQLLVVP
jgi:type II secretory pathway pseudopilin PulG